MLESPTEFGDSYELVKYCFERDRFLEKSSSFQKFCAESYYFQLHISKLYFNTIQIYFHFKRPALVVVAIL